MRIRQRRKKSFLKTFVILICITMTFFLGLGYSLLSEEIEVTGVATALVPEVIREFNHTTITQGTHINHNFTNIITNIGTAPASSWEFTQSIPDDANTLECTNMVCERINNTVYMSNTLENGSLDINESITTTLTFRTSNPDYEPEPDPDPDPDPDPEEPIDLSEYISVSFEEIENIRSGSRRYITYEFTLANANTEHDTSKWEFYLNGSSEGVVDNISGALIATVGGNYRIYNSVTTGVIAAEGERNFELTIDIHHNRTWDFVITDISAED